jgi:hypothetical protein
MQLSNQRNTEGCLNSRSYNPRMEVREKESESGVNPAMQSRKQEAM